MCRPRIRCATALLIVGLVAAACAAPGRRDKGSTGPGVAGASDWPFDRAAIDRVLAGGPDPRPCGRQPGVRGYPNGYSTFRLDIDREGRPAAVTVAKSEGLTPAIDECLMRGMRPWTFPMLRGKSDAVLFIRVDLYFRDWGDAQGEGANVDLVRSADDPGDFDVRTLPPRREWTRESGSLFCRAPILHPGDPRPTDRSALPMGTPDTKEAIRQVIQAHASEVRACYEARMIQPPYPRGRVRTRFALDSAGRVAHSCVLESTVGDPKIDQCIVDALLTWTFKRPPNAGWTHVEYPWVLVPAE